MRTLVIGDIHGCFLELEELITKAQLTEEDRIIALGDILDRGPDSKKVFEYFIQANNAITIKGNHERKNYLSYKGEIKPSISQVLTRQEFGENKYQDLISFIETLPPYIELPEAILVHGYLEPNIPLNQQKETILAGTLSAFNYLEKRYPLPWYELYSGRKPVIVGHEDYSGNNTTFIYNDIVYGIDTDCCTGGHLTGIILPDFEILSVPSHRNYWKERKIEAIIAKLSKMTINNISWTETMQLKEQLEKPAPYLEKRLKILDNLSQLINIIENTLDEFYSYIIEKDKQVLRYLEQEEGFSAMPQKKQGSAYSKYIGETPIKDLLHLARMGSLVKESFQNKFKKPSDLIKLARRTKLYYKKLK
ncbi:MAG: metallophosphoesterase [Promethearchaeota archaeon]